MWSFFVCFCHNICLKCTFNAKKDICVNPLNSIHNPSWNKLYTRLSQGLSHLDKDKSSCNFDDCANNSFFT